MTKYCYKQKEEIKKPRAKKGDLKSENKKDKKKGDKLSQRNVVPTKIQVK